MESNLGRIKKDQILGAITEGTGETHLEELRKLKKPELVATAEKRLASRHALVAGDPASLISETGKGD